MKHQKRSRFDTPSSHYSVFRDLLRETLSSDPDFKASYLAEEFESKLLDPLVARSPEERRSAAIKKWLDSEELNRQTNVRIMFHDQEDILFLCHDRFPVSAVDVLTVARRFVAETIGRTIPWDELKGSFSGGASTSMRRGRGMIARKYQEGTDISEGAIWHFLRLSKSDVWAPRDFTIARGNVMFTVPKTSQIDRCACKEPELNMFCQKAIGDYFRRCLRRKRIDLNDQTVNQRLARLGSLDGSLATIDLSSASDSVTIQLVQALLPYDWFVLLDDCRSPFTIIDGEEHENAMFSSMGNAFTFELESLIFWALVRACAYLTQTSGIISVYGDDIICPVELEDAVKSTFAFCGFRINPKKSFFEGTFRESCGKHWDAGRDVTPFYVKSVPVSVDDWCHLLNSLRRWCQAFDGICDPRYFDLWSLFAELIPEPLKGHWDLALRSNLCSPGRPPIARLVPRLERDRSIERSYAYGCYIQWLSAAELRKTAGDELVTSEVVYDGDLVIRKLPKRGRRDVPMFPQELGV